MIDIKKWIDVRGLKNEEYLGALCQNNHEYLDTGKSIRRKRIVKKCSKSGKQEKNGKCVCCHKVHRDKNYDKNREKIKKRNRENSIKYRKTEKYQEYYKNTRDRRIEYKRKYRRRDGCELAENIRLWAALKKAYSAPTVIELLNKQIKDAKEKERIEYLKTPEGKAEKNALAAEYSRQRYETDWKTNYTQKEKNQRKKSKNKYNNYVEKKSPEQAKARLLAFDNCCAYCGTSLTMFSVEFDHVIPSSKEGPDIWANIIPACHSCNSNKTNKNMKEWFKSKPFYSKEKLKKIKTVLALTPYPTKQLDFKIVLEFL